jgi:beta-galactosidase/beta-glucuronidase
MKSFYSVLSLTGLLIVSGIRNSDCQVPALRDEITLNGIWSFTNEAGEKSTIPVPEYWDAAPGFTKKVSREYTNDRGEKYVREVPLPSTSIGIYEREIMIPDSWKDKVIMVEFEGVNFIAEVYLNNKLLLTHTGGWTPFKIDITGNVTAGKSATLKVLVKGGSHSPIVDENGYPQWPVGWYGQESRWGIIFDTWLRAYGQVYIDDAFIRTSWRKKSITVDYDLVNSTSKIQEIEISGDIKGRNDDHTVLSLKSSKVSLKPGERKTLSVASAWNDPKPWNPETPYLYTITSNIRSKQGVTDQEERRFGFREIWIEGPKLMLNGNRLNLRGTSINTHGQGYNSGRYKYITEETFNQTVDRLQALNIQCVRFHQSPASKRIIEIADERGLLIVEESPMYARDYILKSNNEVYFRNGLTWLKPWVKDRRNNPSVIMWSSENEIGRDWLKWFSDKQLKTLADSIRAADPTRPVIAEGDFDIGDDFYSDHYPEGVGRTVKGSIYSWDTLISKTKPSSFGEFLYGNTDGKEWWHGTWCRGLRYINAAQMMPYTLDWAWSADSLTDVHYNLKNSYAPVALFDNDYDDLGIDVLRKKQYPELKEKETVTRNLVLYNDCFSDENVQVEVRLESKGKLITNDFHNFAVPLGEHRDFKIEFTVPENIDNKLDLVLITRKNGKLTFREKRSFFSVPGSAGRPAIKPHIKIIT